MAPHKINICIPIHNSSKLLDRALNSLTRQTYKDFLVHIYDDGSTEDLTPVVNKYKTILSINYLKGEKNIGVAKARNALLNMVENGLTMWLDADDIYFKRKLELHGKYHIDTYSPDTKVATYACFNQIRGDFTDTRCFRNPFDLPALIEMNKLRQSTPPILQAIALDIRLYKEIGGFDENYNWGEDLDLYIRLMDSGITFEKVLHNGPLSNYYDNEKPADVDKITSSYESMKEKYKNIFAKYGEDSDSIFEVKKVRNLIRREAKEYGLKATLNSLIDEVANLPPEHPVRDAAVTSFLVSMDKIPKRFI